MGRLLCVRKLSHVNHTAKALRFDEKQKNSPALRLQRGRQTYFFMMTTVERTQKVTPLEKFSVLACDIDLLRQKLDNLNIQQPLDDLLDVVEISELAKRYGASEDLMRKRLRLAGGKVFKLGKQYVIRKVVLLEVLQKLEDGNL